MREALRVLQGCLEHPDADSAITSLQAALQPQPVTQALTYEQQIAIREGHQASAETEYFAARQALDFPELRCIFCAGHRRGYEAGIGITLAGGDNHE